MNNHSEQEREREREKGFKVSQRLLYLYTGLVISDKFLYNICRRTLYMKGFERFRCPV